MGLLDYIKDKAGQAYDWYKEQDTPASAYLRGDDVGEAYERALDNNISLLQTPEGAMDLVNPMAKVGGLLGTFIGKGSKLWNPTSYAKALDMEKAGAKAEDIWKETGNVKAPDGKWRQEISDDNLQFNEDAYKAFRRKREYQGENFNKAKTDLYDLVSHPKLKKAYPESKDTAILRGNNGEGGGSASPIEWDYINLNIPSWEAKAVQANEMKKTLLHELQHQTQSAENFARGGNTDMFSRITPPKNVQKQLKKAKDKYESLLGGSPERIKAVEDYNKILGKGDKYSPYGQYLRLLGEAEARMTANRMNLTPKQRLQHYPYAEGQYGLDVPIDELVVEGII